MSFSDGSVFEQMHELGGLLKVGGGIGFSPEQQDRCSHAADHALDVARLVL